MKRFMFMIKMGWFQRKKIREVSKNDKYHIKTITHLNIHKLRSHGIRYLALDFDGVLAPHSQSYLDKDIFQWLTLLCDKYSAANIFILSNNPTAIRVEYFCRHFPGIRFIEGVAKKPYPNGLFKIMELTKCKSYELALVDDRLLTGCLACILAECFPIFVTMPCKNYIKRPIQEGIFSLFRCVERYVFLFKKTK